MGLFSVKQNIDGDTNLHHPPRNRVNFYQKCGSNTNSISNIHLHCFCKVVIAQQHENVLFLSSMCDYRIYSNKDSEHLLNMFDYQGAFIGEGRLVERGVLYNPKILEIHFYTYLIGCIYKVC